jgi:hypothetical protein
LHFFVCVDLSFFTNSSLPVSFPFFFFDVTSTPVLLHNSRRLALTHLLFLTDSEMVALHIIEESFAAADTALHTSSACDFVVAD